MPKPFTPVSEAALQQISEAIDSMLHDPTLSRTKRQIEKLAGLSHATVARAFVQDSSGRGPQGIRLTERFNELASATSGRSLERAEQLGLEAKLNERNEEIKRLKAMHECHVQALYVYYLSSIQEKTDGIRLVPIGANRPRGLKP
jgi:hypothetical protein